MVFLNRYDAGCKLAILLSSLQERNPLILALPRGGVPVAFEIAMKLRQQLQVLIVRKISLPGRKEFGIGAITEGGTIYLDKDTLRIYGVTEKQIWGIIRSQQEEIMRQIRLYRIGKPLPDMHKRVVLIVDDGLATGVTIKAAILHVQEQHPKEIILAVPVCENETYKELQLLVSHIYCLSKPRDFQSVGQGYQDFQQVSDDEVIHLLQQSQHISHSSRL